MRSTNHPLHHTAHSHAHQHTHTHTHTHTCREILQGEGNVQQIQAPITICGDIHGQYHDLIELFKVCTHSKLLYICFPNDPRLFGCERALLAHIVKINCYRFIESNYTYLFRACHAWFGHDTPMVAKCISSEFMATTWDGMWHCLPRTSWSIVVTRRR